MWPARTNKVHPNDAVPIFFIFLKEGATIRKEAAGDKVKTLISFFECINFL